MSKFLDTAGNKLNYRRYAEPLFDVLFAGGILGNCHEYSLVLCIQLNKFNLTGMHILYVHMVQLNLSSIIRFHYNYEILTLLFLFKAPGGSLQQDGDPYSTEMCVFGAEENIDAIKAHYGIFYKLIRRYKYLEKSFEEELKKVNYIFEAERLKFLQ